MTLVILVDILLNITDNRSEDNQQQTTPHNNDEPANGPDDPPVAASGSMDWDHENEKWVSVSYGHKS